MLHGHAGVAHPALVVGLLLLAAAAQAAPPGQMLKRQVHGALPVASGGEAAAAIIAPAEPAMREVAIELAQHLRAATGAEVPLIDEREAAEADGRTLRPELRQRSLILVGNALNNRALFPLYCRWLDAADGKYPGGEGFELRTVVNPYGTGCHQLVLGATTPAGARAGLEALKARIAEALAGQNLTLPQLLEVRVGDELRAGFEQAVAEVRANPQRAIGPVLSNGDLANFALDALRYAWTGERAFAERAAGVLREMNARFDGEYYHGDVRTCDDYALEYAVRGWLVLQHAGVLTADELWETDRNLYRDFPLSAHGPGNVGSRHLASGSMAWFLALDGLLTYGNPDAEARRQLEAWREGVRAYFHGACRTYRGDVDQAQDYGALENVFRYAVHDGHWEYFTSGWADKTIAQMLMNVDNQGWYSGVGGYGESMPGSLNYPVAIGVCLPITAMVERRGDLRWIRENVPNLTMSHLGFQVLGVHAFDMGAYVPPVAPHGELTGLTVLPLSEYHWKLAQTPTTDGVGPVTTPLDRCVDKLMLRAGFGRNDQYLLLNGFQNTVMGCLDGNAIVRFCDRGEVCLFQSTQEEGHDTKNAVWVSNGRNDDALEGCVERGPMADLGEVCFSSTTLPRYHGADWERNLLWRKGGVLVVMDRLTVREPGSYTLACTWRSPRYARLAEDGRWQARTERGVFTVASAATPPTAGPHPVREGPDGQTSLQLSPTTRTTSSLGDDRFAAEVPWVLREWKRLAAPQAGDVVEFQNALYLRTEDRPQDYELLRVSEGVALLAGGAGGESALLTRGPRALGDELAVEAEFAWLEAGRSYVGGLRRLGVGSAIDLRAEAAVNVTLRSEGEAVLVEISAPEATALGVRLAGLRAVRLDGATHALDGETVRVDVPPGAHVLACDADGRRVRAALGRVLAAARARAARRGPTTSEAPAVPSGRWPLRSVWSYDGLRNAGRRERNLTVTSQVDGGDPQAGPYAVLTDTLFRHTVSADVATVWPASRVQLTLELPAPARIAGVRLHNYYGAVDFDTTKPDPCRVAEVAVSDDGFRQDVRRVEQPATRRYQYLRGCYGSQFFSEVIDSLDGVDRVAKALRVTLERPEAGSQVRLGAVELLAEGGADSRVVKARPIRWSAKGPESWVIWGPDEGELAVLDGEGNPRWTHDLHAAVTGLACDDADGDGLHELAVTAADWRVRLFNRAGDERIVKDWRGVYEATAGKYYYGGQPHGVGFYPLPGRSTKELAVGHYYFLSALGLDGSIRKTHEGYACYWQDFLDTGLDLNGNGATDLLAYAETPWQTRVPVVTVDGATREPVASFPAGNGGARLFRLVKAGDEDCVAVGSHKGCGLYSLTQNAYKWYRGGEVYRGAFFVADLEGNGQPTMLVGQRDGLLAAIDAAGRTALQVDVGEEVLGVAALPTSNGLRLFASTAGGTGCYDAEGRLLSASPLVAQRFEPATVGARPALLAVHRDGRVELLAAD